MKLPAHRFGSLSAVCLVAVTAAAAAQDDTDSEHGLLDRRHAEFLETVDPILTDTERRVLRELRHAYQRDAFVQRFWAVRDPFPETPMNEFREQFDAAVEVAEERFGGVRDARFEAWLLHGKPLRMFRTTCDLLRPLDVWHYPHSPAVRGEFYLIFLRQGGEFRLWRAVDGLAGLVAFNSVGGRAELLEEIALRCSRGGDLLTALSLALDWQAMGGEPSSSGADDEWALAFLDRSTETPAGVEQLPTELSLSYPGRRGGRTVVQAIVEVGSAGQPAPGGEVRRFVLDGEVLRQDELFETFRYRFDQPARAYDETPVPLVVQRYLRPGAYRLAVKVRELEADRFFGAAADIEVPLVRPLPPQGASASGVLADTEPGPAGTSPDAASSEDAVAGRAEAVLPDWLAEANALRAPAEGSGTHTVRLQPLPERLLTGLVRVGAGVEGSDVHRVAFALDGREVISKRQPPYEVDVDLGPAPRVRRLEALAYDRQGEVLASDEVLANSGPHRFVVRLIEPRRGGSYGQSVRAAVEVETPRHERLDRVEFFLNDTRMATLYQPPFEQPIRIDPEEPLSFVRAVAWLDTGAWAEDVVFVNSRNLVEEVDVALIELYTSVVDRSGAPILGLVEADFSLVVDGEPRNLHRFDNAADQPIHAGVLFDTSLSMEARLEAAEEAALHFFELILGPNDRASLITFNDRPELAVGFTGSREALAGGLAGISTEGQTALYDSILYSLYYFGGLRGKRALILLTDGADSTSEYRFEYVLDFARRSQVAIYSIGIDIDRTELRVRGRLQQLCNETGGRCFFITSASELKRVYERIETEVRAQYLLAFEAPQGEGETYHEVRVELNAPRRFGRGVKVLHLPGYFQ